MEGVDKKWYIKSSARSYIIVCVLCWRWVVIDAFSEFLVVELLEWSLFLLYLVIR